MTINTYVNTLKEHKYVWHVYLHGSNHGLVSFRARIKKVKKVLAYSDESTNPPSLYGQPP